MLTPDDFSAYLARIGYDGPIVPTRSVLAALQLAHLRAIPFETVASFTGHVPAIDLPGIVAKLVRSPRGGYCYEHNRLFHAVLETVGFAPVGLLARVLLGSPETAATPRTHMLLTMSCEGEDLLADVGFGGQVPTGPILLRRDAAQETPHEPYRLEESGGVWGLRALVGGEWRLLYRFTLEPAVPIDYVVANHYVATHPSSFFAQALVAARILPRGRLTLLNRRLTEHGLDRPSKSEEIGDDARLRSVLDGRFGIGLDDAVWNEVLRRLPPA